MIERKSVVVVLPAYNAARTLRRTVAEIPACVDHIILVDDHSGDETVSIARELGLQVLVHERNRGYGGNQKSCYCAALNAGADVVVMLHPDYQYTPVLITSLAGMVASGAYDVALGSRLLGRGALRGGMPRYKYVCNRALTIFQNAVMGAGLSEYHTGFRAFSSDILRALPLETNSEDFVFDNQVLSQCILLGARIGEISCPTHYFPEASSISFRRSMRYGAGVVGTSLKYAWARWTRAPLPGSAGASDADVDSSAPVFERHTG